MRQRTEVTAKRVGSYRLLAKIGEGGMGVVHLAQDADGHRVALKVLRPHVIGDDEARERLSREVASLRRIRSPRIAEVIDADPRGETPFVATRYVPGLSLHEHVREHGPLAGDDLRHFAAGLAEAMLAVHAVGVLHRDIKPSNVLLEGRSPVLIDFGLARLAEDPKLTITGWLLGTPGYLAPEILYGEEATHASDVHAWAATVAFAASGHAPFGRGPAMAIMDRVRRGEHDLSGVPADLQPLLRRCLAPEPAGRPDAMSALTLLRAEAYAGDALTLPIALGGDDAPTEIRRTHVVGPATTATRFDPWPTQLQEQSRPTGRPERGALLLALFALVTTAFAAAPYLSVLGLALTVLAVRAVSWTTDAAQDRQWRRGRRRWYDRPLTVVTSPWYAVVAVGGTLVLMVWSVALSFVVGLGYALFGLPLRPGLFLMGAVLAVAVWWGPGSRRVRAPTRRLGIRLARWPWLAWLLVSALLLAAGGCALMMLNGGVAWDPMTGPPWRPGTLLGDLLRMA